MRHYEIMLLIHPDRGDQAPSMIEHYKQLIESQNGKVHRLENIGGRKLRRLAYPIKKLHKAYYVLMNIECTVEQEKALQDSMVFNDAIIRSLSIRQQEAITRPSLLYVESAGTEKDKDIKETMDDASNKSKRKFKTLPAMTDEELDYKNVDFLMNYITDTKKMSRRRVTGANAKQQHRLSQAIKRARLVGLLPHCDKYAQPEAN